MSFGLSVRVLRVSKIGWLERSSPKLKNICFFGSDYREFELPMDELRVPHRRGGRILQESINFKDPYFKVWDNYTSECRSKVTNFVQDPSVKICRSVWAIFVISYSSVI